MYLALVLMTEFIFGPQKQGITTTNCNIELVERCDLVVMAVKPHLVSDILQEISDFFTNEKMFVSIAAGVPLEILETVSPIIQIPLFTVFICFVLGNKRGLHIHTIMPRAVFY